MRTVSITLFPLMIFLAACSQEPTTTSTEQTGLESTLGSIARNSSAGAELTRKKCGSCHYLDRNIRKIGPSLKSIYGKESSISDVPFEVWNDEALDKWLSGPRDIKKSTRMAIPGISDPAERKAIIDYLKLI